MNKDNNPTSYTKKHHINHSIIIYHAKETSHFLEYHMNREAHPTLWQRPAWTTLLRFKFWSSSSINRYELCWTQSLLSEQIKRTKVRSHGQLTPKRRNVPVVVAVFDHDKVQILSWPPNERCWLRNCQSKGASLAKIECIFCILQSDIRSCIYGSRLRFKG